MCNYDVLHFVISRSSHLPHPKIAKQSVS